MMICGEWKVQNSLESKLYNGRMYATKISSKHLQKYKYDGDEATYHIYLYAMITSDTHN